MRRAMGWLVVAGLVLCCQWGCEEGGSDPTAARSDSGGGSGPPPLKPLGPATGGASPPGEQPSEGPPREQGEVGEHPPHYPEGAHGTPPGPGPQRPGQKPPGYVEEGYPPHEEMPVPPPKTTPGYPGPSGPPDLVRPPQERGPIGPRPGEEMPGEGYGPGERAPGPGSPPPAGRVAFQPASPEEATSAENLRRIAQALLAYERQNRTFPPAATHVQGTRGLSWRVELLPYLGFQDLYQRFNRNEPWDSAQNKALAAQIPDVYRTPGLADEGKTCYLAPVGVKTVFNEYGGQGVSAISDGAGNTVILVEADADKAVEWTQPQDLDLIPALPTSGLGNLRGESFLAAMADGSVHRISTEMDAQSVLALFTATGGERVDLASLSPQAGPGGPGTIAKAGLVDQARTALAAGYPNDAHQFLLAAAAVGEDEEVLGRIRWSEELRRPALAVRWGVGILATQAPRKPGREEPGGEVPPGFGEMPGFGQGSSLAQALRSAAGSAGPELAEQLEALSSNEQIDQWLAATEAPGEQRGAAPHRLGDPVFVGTSDAETLSQKALEEGLDVLVTVAVSTRSGGSSGSGGRSTLVVRIMDVTKGRLGRKLWSSRPLTVSAGSGGYGEPYGEMPVRKPPKTTSDYASRFVETVVRQLERSLKLEDMPERTETEIHNSAALLANREHVNPLPALMELRYYAWKGLLPEAEFNESCTKILGAEDGAKLAADKPEERLAAIKRWIPQPKAVKPSRPGFGGPGMEGEMMPPGTVPREGMAPGAVPREGPFRQEMPVEGRPRQGVPLEEVPLDRPPRRLDSRGFPDS